MSTVAILAGGLATRLAPLSTCLPKALIDVAGKPFIVRQLESLRAQGLARVVLCIGHMGEQIRAMLGDGSALGIELLYSCDGPRLLGTGGALRRAMPLLGERFFVLYGDTYLNVDFAAVERAFLACGQPALMTVMKNDNRWDRSNVEFAPGRPTRYDKRNPGAQMRHIDYGLAMLAASVLEPHAAGEAVDLADIYHALSTAGRLAGHEVFQRFHEIGSHAGLKETIDHFNRQDGR